MSVRKTRPAVPDDTPESDAHAPRPLTRIENVVLTLKVGAIMGLLGAALWTADFWMAAK